jgi:hypothetical protein
MIPRIPPKVLRQHNTGYTGYMYLWYIPNFDIVWK